MIFQRNGLNKTLGAFRTLLRLFTGVYHLMITTRFLFGKTPIAVLTGKVAYLFVYNFAMSRQIARRIEFHFAASAGILLLPGVGVHVYIQAMLCDQFQTTLHALEASYVFVPQRMLIESGFDAKTFATVWLLAGIRIL